MNSKTMKSIRALRSIHLIDIENLCGASNPTLEQVAGVKAEYERLVNPGSLDLFYVTVSSKSNLEAAMFGWPGARVEVLEGHDGADILLAKELLDNHLSEDFHHIYLGSGDGGLAPFISREINNGGSVSVISKPRCLSFQMRRIGAEVRYLQNDYQLVA